MTVQKPFLFKRLIDDAFEIGDILVLCLFNSLFHANES